MASDLDSKLKEILAADPRYKREAYHFLFEALQYTVNQLGVRRHVSGQELLEGIRAFAQEQFGGLARTVFAEWGVRRTADFGEIVFNLVERSLMGKTEQDSREDFRDVYDFAEAFPMDYAPPREPKNP
jgi:uncharacterized repeat protein (TIGR04138 family)